MDYDSIEELERKLTQFAPGTRLYWEDPLGWPGAGSLERWTWSERNALFERVRASAARHGVTIQPSALTGGDEPAQPISPRRRRSLVVARDRRV